MRVPLRTLGGTSVSYPSFYCKLGEIVCRDRRRRALHSALACAEVNHVLILAHGVSRDAFDHLVRSQQLQNRLLSTLVSILALPWVCRDRKPGQKTLCIPVFGFVDKYVRSHTEKAG